MRATVAATGSSRSAKYQPCDPGLLPEVLAPARRRSSTPGRVGQQVADRDRPLGVHDVVAAARAARRPSSSGTRGGTCRPDREMRSLPSSCSFMAATLTRALVCEAMRKIASSFMGALRLEVALARTRRVGDLAAPRHQHDRARELAVLDVPCRASVRRCSRSEERPTSSGRAARGRAWARSDGADRAATSQTAASARDIRRPCDGRAGT